MQKPTRRSYCLELKASEGLTEAVTQFFNERSFVSSPLDDISMQYEANRSDAKVMLLISASRDPNDYYFGKASLIAFDLPGHHIAELRKILAPYVNRKP